MNKLGGEAKTFIFLSSCAWNIILQRPHHMARALCQLGNKVHFMEPHKQRYDSSSNNIDIARLTKYWLDNKRVIDGVSIYRPLQIYYDNSLMNDNELDLIQAIINASNQKVVIICYFPRHINVINKLSGDFKIVYDCVDDHNDLEYSYWSSSEDIELESLLLDRADVTLTTSSALYLTKVVGRTNVFLSKNAFIEDDFTHKPEDYTPRELNGIPKPRICYIGAVDKWFNEELFYRLLEENKDKAFVVIGPISNGLLNKRTENLFLLGVKKHEELKNYLREMDVGIIPFKDDIDLIINCNPIKLYEYLACGLPVVSTNLPELCGEGDFISTCLSKNEFNEAISSMLNYKFETEAINGYLERNTYINRAAELILILDNKIDFVNYKVTQLHALRKTWEKFLQNKSNSLLSSLYGMTFIEEDASLFLEHCRKAFESLKIPFTTKNYIFALYLNDDIETAVNIVKEDTNVSDLLKAELVSALNAKDLHLVKIKLMHCIKKYDEFKKLLLQYGNSKQSTLEWAHYYFETGQYEKGLQSYNRALVESTAFNYSTLANHNLSKAFKMKGNLYNAQIMAFRSQSLIDYFLNTENRIVKWSKYFNSAVKQCILCGCSEFEEVVHRPDSQTIVSCKNCGLAFLNRLPSEGNLKEIYASLFCSEKHNEITTDISSYLHWVEATLLNKGEKKLLDLSDNRLFSELCEKNNWNCHHLSKSTELPIKSNIKEFTAKLHDVNFENDSFDCITLWDVLEDFTNPLWELSEIYRILRKGGKLYMSVLNHLKGKATGANWIGYSDFYHHLYYFEPDTLISMLKEAGFKIDDCFSCDGAALSPTNIMSIGNTLYLSAHK